MVVTPETEKESLDQFLDVCENRKKPFIHSLYFTSRCLWCMIMNLYVDYEMNDSLLSRLCNVIKSANKSISSMVVLNFSSLILKG